MVDNSANGHAHAHGRMQFAKHTYTWCSWLLALSRLIYWVISILICCLIAHNSRFAPLLPIYSPPFAAPRLNCLARVVTHRNGPASKLCGHIHGPTSKSCGHHVTYTDYTQTSFSHSLPSTSHLPAARASSVTSSPTAARPPASPSALRSGSVLGSVNSPEGQAPTLAPTARAAKARAGAMKQEKQRAAYGLQGLPREATLRRGGCGLIC